MRAITELPSACWIIGLACKSAMNFAGSRRTLSFIGLSAVPPSLSSSEYEFVPAGQRVPDIDQWLRFSSNSLLNLTGKTLLEEISVPLLSTFAELHYNERYAVLSHGTQADPIYNYFNRAALLQFEYPESEIYSLASRYSAPAGSKREEREKLMKGIVSDGYQVFPKAIRITKFGDLFQLTNVLLWNVYDDDGNRIGQTALFDRQKIVQPVVDVQLEAQSNNAQP